VLAGGRGWNHGPIMSLLNYGYLRNDDVGRGVLIAPPYD